MNVRRYKIGEEEEIWKLYFNTTRKINRQHYTQAQVERWAPDVMDSNWNERLRRINPFVTEHDDKLVGFAELEANGHIDRFYCHHEWQRKGVGKQLYQAIEEEASRLKIDLLFTEVSVTAREFFLSRGFEIVKEENLMVCGAVAKRFQMRKRLTSANRPPKQSVILS